MATDYTEFVTLAKELISDNGRSVTIQRYSSVISDAAKPWKGPGTPTIDVTRVLPAVFVPASSGGLGKDLVRDELLSRVEQVCLVAPTDISLEDFTTVLDNGVRWNIDWAQVLAPGAVTLLYVFGVKR